MRKQLSKSSLLIMMLTMTSCQTAMLSNAWENTKTAYRYLKQSGQALVNSDAESRLVSSKQEFFGEEEYGFVPLSDTDMQSNYVDYTVPQAKEVPGEIGGAIPGIDAFSKPSRSQTLSFQRFISILTNMYRIQKNHLDL